LDNASESNGNKPDDKKSEEEKQNSEEAIDKAENNELNEDDTVEVEEKRDDVEKIDESEKTEKQKLTKEETIDEEPVKDEPIQDSSEVDGSESKEKSEKTKKDKGESGKKDLKKEKDDDFSYIVRIANTDIDGNKKVTHGLTSIKGIGMHIASLIIDTTGIDPKIKMGDLTEPQIEKIRNTIDDIENIAPKWMLNHRKDYETGKDMHLTGSEIDMRLRDEINIMKKIRSYRGIRHERGLRARGQRTRSNNRSGLTLGVSKKRPQ